MNYKQNELIINKSRLHDVCELKNRLRKEHLKEISLDTGNRPENSLLAGLINSPDCFTASMYIGKRLVPVQMFGVIPSMEKDRGLIWSLGSEEIDKIPRQVSIASKNFLKHFLNKYNVLYNWVDADYSKGIRFIEFLGGKVFNPIKKEKGYLCYFQFTKEGLWP